MIPSTEKINEHIQLSFDHLKGLVPEMHHETLKIYLRLAFMGGWIQGQGELAVNFLARERRVSK
jgi:hypothetical protein